MIIVPQSATLLTVTPDAARLIEAAGRTCYKSEGNIGPDTAAPFIATIEQRGHLSVLEHASATFRLVTDRGVTHELVRHRVASYSQESTRYCDYAKKPLQFIQPIGLEGDALDVWREAVEEAEKSYLWMRANGVTPELARSVLPNSLKTEIVMTANFREWLHVLALRTAKAAHPQMRALMELVRVELQKACPEVFA